MASVSKKGNHYLIRVYIGGRQEKIYGFTNRREAERTGDKIESLIAARKTGDMPADLAVWVAKLADADSVLYEKLAKHGLVEQVEEKHTLSELFEKHRASRRDVTASTRLTYEKVESNLSEFFGADYEVKEITFARADAYAVWLRETPLNRRTKGKRIGWIAESPFQFLKGGESVNPERWEYVDVETVEAVVDACHLPKWRAIMALGRFAGLRGSSEAYGLLWEDVKWSDGSEPGSLIIRAEKNKRHGRQFRTVPMHPTVERELAALFEQAQEKEPRVFPDMEKRTNFGTMTRKLITAANVPLWVNP